MESKSIYSSMFFPLYNDPSSLTCVYHEVFEEISTDVSNSTQISQDTKVCSQVKVFNVNSYFPIKFSQDKSSEPFYLHSLVLSTKNWCRTYNIHSEIASMFYSNQKETASNTLNMIFWSRNTEIVFSIKVYSNNISFIHSLQCTEYWHASFVSVLSSNFRTNVLVKSIIKWNTTEEYL